MSHKDMTPFSIQIPVNDPKAMEEFQEAMNTLQDAHVEYEKKLMIELNISHSCASDITYLRSRSRWTQELENKLIQLHNEENPPNIFAWP